MIEYTDSLGQIFGLFGLLLILVAPVVLNRLLEVKYPLAMATLAAFFVVGSLLERLLFNLLFDIEPSVGPLDGLFMILVPIYGYVLCLLFDLVAYRVISRRKVTVG